MIYKIGKIILILFLISFYGCSSALSLGHEQGYCEENGFDYTDAGVCGTPMKIYKYRKFLDIN